MKIFLKNNLWEVLKIEKIVISMSKAKRNLFNHDTLNNKKNQIIEYLSQKVIPAQAGISMSFFSSGFPIKRGMTSIIVLFFLFQITSQFYSSSSISAESATIHTLSFL
ncbi:MAG TPA: hypothetical protein DHW82_03210 [Spirochaetia bacterium]|nr:hypothetical protein [Spirochaetia bacterium]